MGELVLTPPGLVLFGILRPLPLFHGIVVTWVLAPGSLFSKYGRRADGVTRDRRVAHHELARLPLHSSSSTSSCKLPHSSSQSSPTHPPQHRASALDRFTGIRTNWELAFQPLSNIILVLQPDPPSTSSSTKWSDQSHYG